MVKVIKILLILVFLVPVAKAQLKIISTINQSSKALYVDQLDNIYLITHSNEILKYNSKAKLIQRYSNSHFGQLSKIDVSNPLRLLVYYKNQQHLIVLDNNLSQVASYSFAKNGQIQIEAIASSNANQFWAFDSQNLQLILFNSKFQEQFRSPNLLEIADNVSNIQDIYANDNFVLLRQIDGSLLKFDRYGAYFGVIKIYNTSNYCLNSNHLIFVNQNKLFSYNLLDSELKETSLPAKLSAYQVFQGNKIVAVLTEKDVLLLSNN